MAPSPPSPPRLGAALLWTAVLVGACAVPRRTLRAFDWPIAQPFWPFVEPVAHVLLFAVSAALWLRAFPRHRTHVFVGGLLLSLLTEAAQTFPGIGRGAEAMDVVLDVVGITLGMLAAGAFRSGRISGQPG